MLKLLMRKEICFFIICKIMLINIFFVNMLKFSCGFVVNWMDDIGVIVFFIVKVFIYGVEKLY